MRLAKLWSLAVVVALLGAGTAASIGTAAQDAPTSTPAVPGQPSPLRETLFQAAFQSLPAPPAFIRLVRISLRPGASVPLHTHPGPEFGRVETGTLTVLVEGEVVVAEPAEDGTQSAPGIPPVGEEFPLPAGSQIVFPAGVPLSFSNRGSETVTFLAAVVLPAGNQRPPGAEWVDGTPGPGAFEGVTSLVLGDAVAPGWPAAPLAVVIDRLVLAPGESLPPRAGPTMLAVELGQFGFALVEGPQLQVSRGASGPQVAATPGTAYVLNPGDAVFFPGGMTQVPRPENDGVLVVLRLSVAPTGGAAASAGSSAAAPTGAAGATTAAFQAGATVVVTQSGVRLRDSPSTAGGVVAELGEGRELVVTGAPVEGDGIVWYPVSAADDPAVIGFIAEEFLATP